MNQTDKGPEENEEVCSTTEEPGAVLGKNIWAGLASRPVCRNVVWGVESPSPAAVGSGEGAVPPPQKNFGIFSEMAHFDAFWSTFLTFLGVSTP